jgi:two-component system, chemotaxis family, chemotaxis protein CheY
VKILVVDDSKAMRMIVIRNLRQAGYADATIVEAGNGAEGASAVQAEEPDLILSDWNMPEVSGIEFLRTIRAAGVDTTFGFVTSESTPAMREQAIAGGASFLLAKPFNAESFQDVLHGVLS